MSKAIHVYCMDEVLAETRLDLGKAGFTTNSPFRNCLAASAKVVATTASPGAPPPGSRDAHPLQLGSGHSAGDRSAPRRQVGNWWWESILVAPTALPLPLPRNALLTHPKKVS